MRIDFRLGASALVGAALLLSACSQENAPSEEVAKAAEDIVETAQGTGTPTEANGKFAPRDDCGDLEGANAFRENLAAVVEARDVNGFVALAAQDIKLDFGGGAGADELRSRLSGEGSNLWRELDELLVLGCAANSQGGITIPWFFAQELPGDPFQSMLVTGQDIPLIGPADGKAIDRISWDVVTLADGLHPDQPFQAVSYKPGKDGEVEEGFVATAQLRSLIDYRLVASRRNGKWSITSFIAGD